MSVNKTITAIINSTFPEQRKFILDESPMKVAHCSRRASKTYSAIIMAVIMGLLYPGSEIAYATLSLKQSRGVLRSIIRELNSKYNLNLELKLENILFPNGTIISLFGLDKDESQQEKFRGYKFRLVIIDEAQSITTDLEEAIDKAILPAQSDIEGSQLVMLGTSNNDTSTYFYKITHNYRDARDEQNPTIILSETKFESEDDPARQWSYHCWLAEQNTYTAKTILSKRQKQLKVNPNLKSTDKFKQEWLALWVITQNKLIYKYTNYNKIDSLPPGEYTYVLGVDVGYNDHDAYSTLAYNETDRNTYLISTFKIQYQNTGDTLRNLRHFASLKDYSVIVIDGADKKGIEYYKEILGENIIAATKTGKYDFIQIFNFNLQSGTFKILPQAQKETFYEWDRLIWDPKNPRKEKEGLDNHISDSVLYASRYIYSMHNQELIQDYSVKTPDQLLNEAWEQELNDIIEKHLNNEEDPLSEINERFKLWT